MKRKIKLFLAIMCCVTLLVPQAAFAEGAAPASEAESLDKTVSAVNSGTQSNLKRGGQLD